MESQTQEERSTQVQVIPADDLEIAQEVTALQKGSRLAAPMEIEQQLGAIYSLFSAVEGTGRVQRSVVHTLDVRADGVVAARLGREESTPLVHLERLRLARVKRLLPPRLLRLRRAYAVVRLVRLRPHAARVGLQQRRLAYDLPRC